MSAVFGFIGFGNMGSVVVRTLLKNGSLDPSQVIIYNRTPERLAGLSSEHPTLHVAISAAEVARASDVLFICTRSTAVCEIMIEIKASLRPHAHLVTINGGVEMRHLQDRFPGAVTKIVPSMTLEAGRGVTLMCHGDRVERSQKDRLTGMFGRSSKVMDVSEEQFEAAADMTSCAPGLLAEMMQKFAEKGAEKGGLTREEALEMVLETMLGTAILLTDGERSPEELKAQVATKGGITEQGLRVLDKELPAVYEKVYQATLGKHEEVKKAITEAFDRSDESC